MSHDQPADPPIRMIHVGDRSMDGLPLAVVVLDAPGDAGEYARVLYSRLRAADAAVDVLVAVPPADIGIGAAVADRLRRAGGTAA